MNKNVGKTLGFGECRVRKADGTKETGKDLAKRYCQRNEQKMIGKKGERGG
jgi:hypothetical protein